MNPCEIPYERFDEKLREVVDRANPRAHMVLLIPGVYEILAEYFNNDVIAELEADA